MTLIEQDEKEMNKNCFEQLAKIHISHKILRMNTNNYFLYFFILSSNLF